MKSSLRFCLRLVSWWQNSLMRHFFSLFWLLLSPEKILGKRILHLQKQTMAILATFSHSICHDDNYSAWPSHNLILQRMCCRNFSGFTIPQFKPLTVTDFWPWSSNSRHTMAKLAKPSDKWTGVSLLFRRLWRNPR